VNCQVRRFAAYRLAVLDELLAVIGVDDDSHVIDEPDRSQLVEEPLKLVVQISDPYVLEGLMVATPSSVSSDWPRFTATRFGPVGAKVSGMAADQNRERYTSGGSYGSWTAWVWRNRKKRSFLAS